MADKTSKRTKKKQKIEGTRTGTAKGGRWASFEHVLELIAEEGIKNRARIVARGMCQESSRLFPPKHGFQNEPQKGCRSTSSTVVRRQKEQAGKGVDKVVKFDGKCEGSYVMASLFTVKQ